MASLDVSRDTPGVTREVARLNRSAGLRRQRTLGRQQCGRLSNADLVA